MLSRGCSSTVSSLSRPNGQCYLFKISRISIVRMPSSISMKHIWVHWSNDIDISVIEWSERVRWWIHSYTELGCIIESVRRAHWLLFGSWSPFKQVFDIVKPLNAKPPLRLLLLFHPITPSLCTRMEFVKFHQWIVEFLWSFDLVFLLSDQCPRYYCLYVWI